MDGEEPDYTQEWQPFFSQEQSPKRDFVRRDSEEKKSDVEALKAVDHDPKAEAIVAVTSDKDAVIPKRARPQEKAGKK